MPQHAVPCCGGDAVLSPQPTILAAQVVVNAGLWLDDPDVDAITRLCNDICATRSAPPRVLRAADAIASSFMRAHQCMRSCARSQSSLPLHSSARVLPPQHALICAGIIGPRVLRQRKGHGRRSTRRTPHSRASSASRPRALLLECPGSTVMPQPPARQHPSSISPNTLQFRRHGPVQLPGGAF